MKKSVDPPFRSS